MPRKKAAPPPAKSKKRKEPEPQDENKMAVDDTAEPSPKKLKKTLPKPAKFTKARLKKYFETYKDEDGQLGPEQMLKLCEDAKIDPADVGMLVLAWKIKAKRSGVFTQEEFLNGFEQLKIDSPEALAVELEKFREELGNKAVLADVYKFAFDFSKESDDKKTIDLDYVIGLLSILLPSNPHTARFCTFLKEQQSYRAMSQDHWRMWYEFCTTVGPAFKEYDVMMAWPSIVDEYVEYQQNLTQPK